MRLSRFHLHTSKETPAEAEIVSHKLMLKAGMIRKLAAGLYTWSPLGLRVLRKVEKAVREEMDAAGAIELLMPTIQPQELWEETDAGRSSAASCSRSRTARKPATATVPPRRKSSPTSRATSWPATSSCR